MRKIILDTETTGIHPEEGHRIVEIAAIEFNGKGASSSRRLHYLFNPEREVDYGAAEVHGLTWSRLKYEPRFAEKADEIAEFIRDSELIMHNAPFDVGFLNAGFERVGIPEVRIVSSIITDTLELARSRHPYEKNGLHSLCQRYGVDTVGRTSHGALLDAELLSEVYQNMHLKALH